MSEAKKPVFRGYKSPYKEMRERGITEENWLDNLDSLTDKEVTAMLNLSSKNRKGNLDEERKASPDISDRQRAELIRDFVL